VRYGLQQTQNLRLEACRCVKAQVPGRAAFSVHVRSSDPTEQQQQGAANLQQREDFSLAFQYVDLRRTI